MPMKDVYFAQWLEKLPSLDGKVVAITGTTSGTGYWAAVCAIRKGAKVVLLLNRASSRADESLKKLEEEKERVQSKTELKAINCDLMSFGAVRTAAAEINAFVSDLGGLDVLANNAGIMAFPDDRTNDGFDKQMQTNHLSHFLLTKLLMPSMQMALDNGKEVRIVQHSSGARFLTSKLEAKYFEKCAKGTLGGDGLRHCIVRYHKTKLANTCFAMALHKKLAEKGFDTTKIKSVVAEPGVAESSLGDSLVAAHTKPGILNAIWIATTKSFISFVQFLFIKQQSGADGALPLIEAAFGASQEVDSGDFFYPEHQSYGQPFKGIAKAEKTTLPKNAKKESGTLSTENQETLWAKSEEAIGESFF